MRSKSEFTILSYGIREHSSNKVTAVLTQNYTQILGNKNYEFTNHPPEDGRGLGNVLTVFTDKKIPQDEDNNGKVDGYEIGIVSIADYSPFGVELDGRSLRSEGYRYGFNSMEKDDEVKGSGNSYDFGARMYDSRVGRWWSRDKIVKSDLSSYQFSRLNPLLYIDKDGNDEYIYWNNYQYYINNGKFYVWNDGARNWKIPKPDQIILDGKKIVTHYMALPSMKPPTEYKATFMISPHSPSTVDSEKMIKKLKSELNTQIKSEAEGKLYDITWNVSNFVSRETGEKQYEIIASVKYFDKVQMNSPMTLSGGDDCQGFNSIESCPISNESVSSTVSSWMSENNFPYSSSLNLGLQFFRYKIGDCNQNIICAFKEESKEFGLFDFKQSLKSKTLFSKNGILYNRNEMGNYLWGAAGKSIGFSLSELEKGGDDYKSPQKDEIWEKRAYKKGYKEQN
jgi:RHS repeat-associated protein